MKGILISAFILVQAALQGQIFIPLQVVNGVVTFEGSVHVKGATDEDVHERTLEWLKTRFLYADVVTHNTENKINAQFTQEYSDGSWNQSYQHDLQVEFMNGQVVFTVTDRQIKLLRPDGTFKPHLNKIKVLFEESINEHYWSFLESIQQHQVRE